MKLKRYQFNSIPFVAIVDDQDCPVDPFLSAYLSSISRQSFNTLMRKAAELLFVAKHFSASGIDLPARVEAGQLVSEREYLEFYDACYLQQKTLGARVSSSPLINLSDKSLRNVISANQRGLASVANETLQGRLRRFREYIKWLFEYFHDPFSLQELVSDRFNKLMARIKADENSLGRNKSTVVANFCDSAIPDKMFLKLQEMILPSSQNNPFKGAKVRNYLIISVLQQSGIRRGALAKLKISDCNFYGTYDQIKIYRSNIDPTDKRIDKPNQKSKAHYATISPILMRQIKHYIDHVRANIPLAGTHDFIFISEKNSRGTLGDPISLKAINSIFKVLSEALQFHIHPHLLRHKWNEVFDENGAKAGLDHHFQEDVRKYAMGWSQNSTMAEIYNEKRLAEKARELSIEHQKRLEGQC
jgi:integrase